MHSTINEKNGGMTSGTYRENEQMVNKPPRKEIMCSFKKSSELCLMLTELTIKG